MRLGLTIVVGGAKPGQEESVGELPSGTVTLLFADVEGSTRLVQQLGVGYGEVLGELAALASAGGGGGGQRRGRLSGR